MPDQPSPWVRILIIVNQRNMRHPTSIAMVNSVTASYETCGARTRRIRDVAAAAGHPLPNLAATQTSALLPLPSDVVELIRRLADPGPCAYDHHGYCQAHGWLETEPRCPHAQAQQLLTAWNDIDPADRQDAPA